MRALHLRGKQEGREEGEEEVTHPGARSAPLYLASICHSILCSPSAQCTLDLLNEESVSGWVEASLLS